MGTEEAKHVVRRFIEELWNQRQDQVAQEILASTCTAHMVSWLFAGDSRHGNDPSFRDAFLLAFPDQVAIIHRLTGEQQPDGSVLVAAWSSFTGTHRGELYGYPATGRRVTVHGYRFFRVEDGMITDYWPLWDWHGLFGQLGFEVPVPAGAPTGPPGLKGSV